MSAAASSVTRDRNSGGWLQSFKPPQQSFANFLRGRLRVVIGSATFEPLEVLYGASCAYVALQVQKPGERTEVKGIVAQVEHLAGLAGEANIAWRVFDEEQLGGAFTYSDGRKSKVAGRDATYGRVFSRCPRGILEKLTESSNPGAKSWRRACWIRVYANEAAGRRPLARGDIAVLPESIRFDDGIERESFLITQSQPLQGIAFGVGSSVMALSSLERMLLPAPKADMEIIPNGEQVEILTLSKHGCIGYLIRTTESRRVIGATSDAALAIAVERLWNGNHEISDAYSAMAAAGV